MVTKDDFHEWKSHPVTEEFMAYLADCAATLGGQSTLRETGDLTIQATAYKQGQLDMIDAMSNVSFAGD